MHLAPVRVSCRAMSLNWPPVTMATQHPDNAGVPWWSDGAFVSTPQEIDELMLLFKELPIDEYMWDWEGKYVDEAVGEKLFSRSGDFFAKNVLGQDLHLTYRIPAYTEGKMHRMARAFMNILALADLAREVGLPRPPVTEMFLPLTTSGDQPVRVRAAFKEIAEYHRSVFHQTKEQENELLRLLAVTPLVEDVASLFRIADIVRPSIDALKAEGIDTSERGMRVFLARSDPALNAGLVPAMLAIRSSLAALRSLSEERGVAIHPVIGTGSLPFRGGVSPARIASAAQAYAGTRTYSIQSAFRYDYPKEEVASALAYLKKEAPTKTAASVTPAEHEQLRAIGETFTKIWQPTIEAIAPAINAVAGFVPPRRERLQHIGLFGYSRGVGAVKLPRAIGFTAALYSVGVPPELVSTGRGLRAARDAGSLPLLEAHYPTLREDMLEAGRSLNRENLALLAKTTPAFTDIQADIAGIEEVLGIELGPVEPHHLIHRNLTSTICQRLYGGGEPDKKTVSGEIVQAATLRRSLG